MSLSPSLRESLLDNMAICEAAITLVLFSKEAHQHPERLQPCILDNTQERQTAPVHLPAAHGARPPPRRRPASGSRMVEGRVIKATRSGGRGKKRSASPTTNGAAARKRSSSSEMCTAERSPSTEVDGAENSPSTDIYTAENSPWTDIYTAERSPLTQIYTAERSLSTQIYTTEKSPSIQIHTAETSASPTPNGKAAETAKEEGTQTQAPSRQSKRAPSFTMVLRNM